MSKPGNSVRMDDAHWRYEVDPRPGRVPVRRYIGQSRRGRVRPSDADRQDLALAAQGLATAIEALTKAHAIEQRELRREAVATALGQLSWVTRQIDSVVERRGGICGDVLDEES